MWRLAPLAGACLALSGCLLQPDSATVRFKVFVNVTVDGVETSGEGVWEARFEDKPFALTDIGTVRVDVRAEAIPLTLPSGEVIYMLRRASYGPTQSGYGGFIGQCPEASGFDALRNFAGGCVVPNAAPMIVAVDSSRTPPAISILRYDDQGPLPDVLIGKVAIDARKVGVIEVRVETTSEPITVRLAGLGWIESLPRLGNSSSFTDFHREAFTTEAPDPS